MSNFEPSTKALALRGLGLVAGLAAAGTLSVATYAQVFTQSEGITLLTDRSGLLMEKGSDVKVAGVVVGTVDDVRRVDDHVELALSMNPDELSGIPANATAVIEPSTLFGRKFVTLVPSAESVGSVRPGDVLDVSTSTVEMNDLFSALEGLLESVDPTQVNTTLTQLASASEGRGDTFGVLVDTAAEYLSAFEDSIPALTRDIGKVADNADLWGDASQDYLDALDHVTTTGTTLIEEKAQFAAFLASLTHLGGRGAAFLDVAGEPIVGAVTSLEPTLALLQEKSPSFGCFLYGMDTTRKYLEPTLGGSRPGFNVLSTILYGDPAYKNGENLPLNTADGPAKCYADTYNGGQQPPQTNFADGSGAYHSELGLDELATSPLWQLLYGPDHLFSGER